MAARRTSSLGVVCVVTGVFVFYQSAPVTFSTACTKQSKVARASYESGKVNAGVEIGGPSTQPLPYLEVDESTNSAIKTCLDEGCSVEALLALDETLARDEQRVVSALEKTQEAQKTGFSDENAQHVVWYDNILKRMGALRAQLMALRGKPDDTDFVKQMIKAAAVAFGGSRPNDYPKSGVSPYSA